MPRRQGDTPYDKFLRNKEREARQERRKRREAREPIGANSYVPLPAEAGNTASALNAALMDRLVTSDAAQALSDAVDILSRAFNTANPGPDKATLSRALAINSGTSGLEALAEAMGGGGIPGAKSAVGSALAKGKLEAIARLSTSDGANEMEKLTNWAKWLEASAQNVPSLLPSEQEKVHAASVVLETLAQAASLCEARYALGQSGTHLNIQQGAPQLEIGGATELTQEKRLAYQAQANAALKALAGITTYPGISGPVEGTRTGIGGGDRK